MNDKATVLWAPDMFGIIAILGQCENTYNCVDISKKSQSDFSGWKTGKEAILSSHQIWVVTILLKA